MTENNYDKKIIPCPFHNNDPIIQITSPAVGFFYHRDKVKNDKKRNGEVIKRFEECDSTTLNEIKSYFKKELALMMFVEKGELIGIIDQNGIIFKIIAPESGHIAKLPESSSSVEYNEEIIILILSEKDRYLNL